MNEQNTKKKGIFILICFLLIMLAVTFLAGKPILSAVSDPEAFRTRIAEYGWAGRLIFFLMMFIQTVIAFIPGEPLEIAAGYAFGAIEGTLLCIAGQAAGSICVFLFVRRYGAKLVRVFVSEEKIASMRFLKNEKKLNAVVFFVFLLPGTPKDALCYFIGLTPMKLSVWAIISLLARIPSIVTSSVGGNALGAGRFWMAVIVFASTVLVSLSGYAVYTRTMKRRQVASQNRQIALTEKQNLSRADCNRTEEKSA